MGRPLDPTVDHRITLGEGAELTSRYRKSGAEKSTESGAFNAKPVLGLLAQPGCVGVRFYRGLTAESGPALVLVGVDAEGNDMTEGLVLDQHLPCPPYCGDGNALNG